MKINTTDLKTMTDPELFRVITLKSLLRLETKGIRKPGISAYKQLKDDFGLRGNKERVLDQITDLLDTEMERRRNFAQLSRDE